MSVFDQAEGIRKVSGVTQRSEIGYGWIQNTQTSRSLSLSVRLRYLRSSIAIRGQLSWDGMLPLPMRCRKTK